ncbi:MAG: DUF3313 family protein [Thermoanaerobaculia bacterium]|nr:DUF3313 family protein [Thermoanaerobaculia bacterium]
MNASPRAHAVLLLLAALATGCATGSAGTGLADSAPEGLRPVPVERGVTAWVRPGAELGAYHQVLVAPPTVSLRDGWLRDHNRVSVHRVTQRDAERIEEGVADSYLKIFPRELSGEGGFEVVTEPRAGALELRASIVDLDVTAPDVPTASRSRTFASTTGEATLVLDLHDAATGTLLARVVERVEARQPVQDLRWTNRATNRAELDRALTRWARGLYGRLQELDEKSAQ